MNLLWFFVTYILAVSDCFENRDSPINIEIKSDVVYADKDVTGKRLYSRNPHFSKTQSRTNSNAKILSSTFYGSPKLSSVSVN